jgi:hypothetical protein
MAGTAFHQPTVPETGHLNSGSSCIETALRNPVCRHPLCVISSGRLPDQPVPLSLTRELQQHIHSRKCTRNGEGSHPPFACPHRHHCLSNGTRFDVATNAVRPHRPKVHLQNAALSHRTRAQGSTVGFAPIICEIGRLGNCSSVKFANQSCGSPGSDSRQQGW